MAYITPRPGMEVDLPTGYTNRLIVPGNPPKQGGIQVSDFGLALGKTCSWATKWCAAACYAARGHCDWRNPASLNCIRRRTWVQHQNGKAWYSAITAMPRNSMLRVGRTGDCGNREVTLGVVKGLLDRPDIRFMWPTRAWRGGRNPGPWQILEKYLPGKVLASVDPTMASSPPEGVPVANVAHPPDYHYPRKAVMCPAYDQGLNCRECGLCFSTSDSPKPLPNIVFKLHTCAAKEAVMCSCKVGKGLHEVSPEPTCILFDV